MRRLWLVLALLSEPCLAHAGRAPESPPKDVTEAVAAVHGGAGPWAVAGYRIGQRALKELGLAKFNFDVQVVHRSPAEVQYACIADGVQAATGASPGKLNLRLEPAAANATETHVGDRRSGRTLRFRLTDAFVKRFLDVPRSGLAEAGEKAAALRDEDIFAWQELPIAARAP